MTWTQHVIPIAAALLAGGCSGWWVLRTWLLVGLAVLPGEQFGYRAHLRDTPIGPLRSKPGMAEADVDRIGDAIRSGGWWTYGGWQRNRRRP